MKVDEKGVSSFCNGPGVIKSWKGLSGSQRQRENEKGIE